MRCRCRGLIALLALVSAGLASAAAPGTIYVGTVLTMDPSAPRAEAVAVTGERIVAVGSRSDVLRLRGEATRVVELGERALLPGFIDSHGHLTAVAAFARYADLASPPVGTIRSIADLQAALRRHAARRALAPGEWIVGVGYDDTLLAERRHPTRDELDAVSTGNPVFLVHTTGHFGVANSRLLAARGIGADTADPAGGIIRRRPGSREPNGVLEESAAMAVYAALPAPTPAEALDSLGAALDDYASRGVTTVQDGGALPANLALLAAAARRGMLDLDVVAYRLWMPIAGPFPADFAVAGYQDRLRIAGIKMLLDGAPQSKTAFLSEPYLKPPAGHDASYRGYPAMPPPAVAKGVRETLTRGVPLIAHANGDAAAELLIESVAAVRRDTGRATPKVVMIHAQTVRDDQLDRMGALGIVPSFFVGHTFFWGDVHRDETLGGARAERISPTRSALQRGLDFTLHNDPPVVPADLLQTLWSAVNRRTRSNDILGPDQRLTVPEALAALTINGARQYGEEADKGTIAAGKLADFVILDRDPLAVPPEQLRELAVDETISHGRSVYRRAAR